MAKRKIKAHYSIPVGDPQEIDRILDQSEDGEFNPVKEKKLEGMSAKELLRSFAEYYYSNNRSVQPIGLHIDPFLEQFNPVKELLKEPEIKKTHSFDRARLEFLRMQIGPVKNFFQTLDNVLVSISERLGKMEQEIYMLSLKDRLQEEYTKYSAEQGRVVPIAEFAAHWDQLMAKEKQNADQKLQQNGV